MEVELMNFSERHANSLSSSESINLFIIYDSLIKHLPAFLCIMKTIERKTELVVPHEAYNYMRKTHRNKRNN